MPFRPVARDLDLVDLERRVLDRWRADDVFAETLRRRTGAPEWVFYEGPPTANGRPGIHHVWARLFKDLYPRFHTMRGRFVARKGGWDCHGLPVEVEVEKELGFSTKAEIEEYGIEAFNARCRESVQRYVSDFEALTERIGMWLDTDDAYWTLSDEYIESVWWQFRRMWDAGLVTEGDQVVPYCGRCGTALSSHELGQPGAYREVSEPSVYVRFPLVGDDADLLVWTTTPWTLVSNVAVAVGPDVDYVRAAAPDGGRDVVVARDRVAAVLGEDATVRAVLPASELVGRGYERPFTILALDDPAALRVVSADFVTTDDGTGIVHLAPAFGEVDHEVAVAESLPTLNPVGASATFDDSVPDHSGTFVKDADPALVTALAESGRLFAAVEHTHSYPHCWRCGTPLVYWAKPTWFARTSERRDDLLAQNESIGWHPEHIKHGRFGDWLANNVDWALSRDRFWGTPLPVWRCTECAHDTCIGSVAELSERSGEDLSELDLHRPFVDRVQIRCPACAGPARRVESVLDAWFDSGSMPAAQFHHPFEHTDLFERRFPADFICEAIDQTRGWFYSLLAVNTLVFGRAPYRNVVCLALVVDQDGQKMSKSKGNVVDPWSVLDTRGADALRWNMFSAGSPWTPKRISPDAIDETTARFLVTLWNTYSFFVTYAELDGWEPDAPDAPPGAAREPKVLDRWIRSRTHATVRDVTIALEGFDAHAGARALQSLVDDVSNWYVRRSRARFWKADDDDAHRTLHEVLRTIALLLAPYCPFVSDELWTNLGATGESVHLADWPPVDTGAIDPDLEAEVALARRLVSLGRAARSDARLGVRRPLGRALVLVPDGEPLRDAVLAEVAGELNVRRVEAVRTLEGLLDYVVTPNFRVLGPRLGPLLPNVQAALADADGAAVREVLEHEGVLHVEAGDTTVALGPGDVEIRAHEHEELALAREDDLAVALDLTIDEDLWQAGVAREVVRAVNDLRRARDLHLADRIVLRLTASGRAARALEVHLDDIAGEVLAVDATVSDASLTPGAARVDVDGEVIGAEIEVVRRAT